jgi:neutral ceramidase
MLLTLAGFSRTDATPEWPVEMAGYPPIRTRPDGPQEHAVYKGRDGLSTGAYLPVYVRSAVLGGGNDLVAIAALDICTVSIELTDAVRARLKKETGGNWNNLFLSASHTHSGPDVCGLSSAPDPRTLEFFIEKISSSVLDALKAQHDCVVTWSRQPVAGLTVNRRHPERPLNSELTQIVFTDANSNSVEGVIQSFACHPIIAGAHNTLLFGDYPSVLSLEVEKHLDERAVCLFLQGPCGDVNPFGYPYEEKTNITLMAPSGSDAALRIRTVAEAERFGGILAGIAIEMLNGASGAESGTVLGTKRAVSLKRRSTEDLDDYLFQRDHDPARVEKWLKKDHINSELGTVVLGNLVVVFLPGEPLTAVANEVRQLIEKSGRQVLIVGYSNDYPGYVVHPDDYQEVRYENAATVLDRDGVSQLMLEAVEAASAN